VRGPGVFDNYAKSKSIIIKDKLIKELEEYLVRILKRINHAKQVMDYADELLRFRGRGLAYCDSGKHFA